MPTVSVIIPAYNRYQSLVYAIDSVLAQTYADLELLVIDDGSTDNTPLIIPKYGNKIRYFYQENRGVSSARNLGIAKSSGKYICFLDSDDLWLLNKLAVQIKFMRSNSEYNVCYTDEIWYRGGVRVNQKKKHAKYSGQIFSYCLPLCIISPSSIMLKSELIDKIGGFDELLPACEDYDLWLRIAKDYPIYFIKQPLILKYGGHSDQLSIKYYGMDRFRVYALLKLLEHGNLSEKQENLVKKELNLKCTIYAAGCYKRGKKVEGDIFKGLCSAIT